MQYDEWLRTSNVLKFSEYISYIKIKKSGPSSGSLHEKKCILLSVVVMHRIGCFTSKTFFYNFLVFLRTPGTQEILIIPENAKNLKEVSPSSMSFRGPPPFNLSSFGVKKIKMKKKKRRGASSRDFVAR